MQGHFYDWSLFLVASIEVIVAALLGKKLLVGAALYDTALLHDHDAVGILDRGKAVGDDKACAAMHQCIHASLDQDLCSGVD